jgi:hypothetical protein
MLGVKRRISKSETSRKRAIKRRKENNRRFV